MKNSVVILCTVGIILLTATCSNNPIESTDEPNNTGNTTEYTVTYNSNGADSGNLSKSTETVNPGGTISSAPTGIARTGYTLSGWNTQADGNGIPFLFGTTTISANITLYAQWYKVTSVTKVMFADALQDGSVAKIKTNKGEWDAPLDSATYAGAAGNSIKGELPIDSGWGGMYLQFSAGVDYSDYTQVSFAINTNQLSQSVDYMEFKLEDISSKSHSVNLFDLTNSVKDGEWTLFTVDLGAFMGVNFAQFKAIGFWHPKSGGANGTYTPGTFFVDNVEFSGTSASFSTLVWSDEFNGTGINTANWGYDIGTGAEKGLNGWGNNEWQYYTNRTDNARIDTLPGGGRGLIIEAKKESYNGSDYTSARLLTQGKQSWTYGRIEARIKLPIGQGIWPAFWMLGSNIETNPWPECGEIDIMEYLGHEPSKVHGTIHYGNPWKYEGDSYSLTNGRFSDDFHVFGIVWSRGEIRWTVDGETYQVKRNWYSTLGDFPAPFDRPFFILLNLAVGGNWPGYPDGTTSFPQKMYVDWVRVYQ